MLTSEFLRRRPKTRARAYDIITNAQPRAHGALRLMLTQARQAIALGQVDTADHIYRTLARQQVAPENIFVQMFRMLQKEGEEDRALSILGESQFRPGDIKRLAQEQDG